MASYFFMWKKQKDCKIQNLNSDLYRRIETANDDYYKVSVLQDLKIRDTIAALKTCQRKILNRCLKKLTKRKQRLALDKWYK